MKKEVCIRHGREDELPQLSRQLTESYIAAYRGIMQDVYLDTLGENHWLPALQWTLEKGGCCLVAEYEGQVVGTAAFGPSVLEKAKGAQAADPYAIYLLPQYTGMGLGGTLFAAAEQAMAQTGVRYCYLEVLEQNIRAAAFYARRGYKKLESYTLHEKGMALPCVKMRRELLPATE